MRLERLTPAADANRHSVPERVGGCHNLVSERHVLDDSDSRVKLVVLDSWNAPGFVDT
jgi:hypothetical protein